jgi:hypothetical protein
MPATVTVRGSPPEATTRTRSPTPSRCARAVRPSMAISPGPLGTRPAWRSLANEASTERPSGARPPAATRPSRPSSWASPLITPVTAATPSARRAASSAEAGMGSANSSPVMSEKISPSPRGAARTTTSTLGTGSA